jgi:plasmid stability protein
MAQMIVRKIDPDVMKRFKALAHERGKSAEQQVRELIEKEAEGYDAMAEFRRKSDALLARWRELGIKFDDSTELIREMRGEIG